MAIPIHEYGDADQLRCEEAPIGDIASDEVMLIKCCIRASAPAPVAPHRAFLHPAILGDTPPRESIEI